MDKRKFFGIGTIVLSLVLGLAFLPSEASARHHRGVRVRRVLHADLRVFNLYHGLQFLRKFVAAEALPHRPAPHQHHAGPNPGATGSKQVIHSYLPQPGENVTVGPANATEQSDRP